MKRQCKREAEQRPYTLKLGHLRADDWAYLEAGSCEFCGSESQEQPRGLQHVAVLDWKLPIARGNVARSCPLCWSMRNGRGVDEFRRKCDQIASFNGPGKKAHYDESAARVDTLDPARVARLTSQIRRRETDKCSESVDAESVALAALAFPCWYCGGKSSGADRLDSLRCPGYELANIVPCCEECNRMKHVMPRGVFLRHAERVASRAQLPLQPAGPH